MHQSFIPAASRVPFADWETIPVRFGAATITLAEARNLKAEAFAEYERSLSGDAHAEVYAIYSAMNRSDHEAKGLTYRAPQFTPAQAQVRRAAVARIEARLLSPAPFHAAREALALINLERTA